jgi:hypothetical protein
MAVMVSQIKYSARTASGWRLVFMLQVQSDKKERARIHLGQKVGLENRYSRKTPVSNLMPSLVICQGQKWLLQSDHPVRQVLVFGQIVLSACPMDECTVSVSAVGIHARQHSDSAHRN